MIPVVAANVALLVLLYEGMAVEALLLAVAVPVGFMLRRRPQFGVLAVAALVPYDGLLEILPFPSAAKDWKEVLVVAVLAATFVAPAEARRSARKPLPGWAPAVMGLLLVGLISGVTVGGLQAITGLRIEYFYLLLGCAIWRCPLSRRDRDKLVTVFMLNGLITSIYGLAQEVIGAGRLAAFGYPYNETIRYTHGFLRAFSSFAYQSPFGYFLMAAMLLGISAALDDPHRRRNQLFMLSLPLLAGALFFTFERGAWLGLVGGLVYMAVRRYRLLLLGVPLLALGLAFIPANARNGSFSSSSLSERNSNWQSHVGQVARTPLGHGIGSSGAAAAKVASIEAAPAGESATNAAVSATYNADDQYLTTAYELGVLGLWFLLLMLFSAARVSHAQGRRPDGSEDTFATATTAIVIGYALGGTVAVIFELFPMDVFWWLLVTTVAASDPNEPSSDRVVASEHLLSAQSDGLKMKLTLT